MSYEAILIDFKSIINPELHNKLINAIQPIPETKFSLGLVLVIKEEVARTLKSLDKGEERINYINTDNFIEGIYGFGYLIYNKRKKLCEIVSMNRKILPLIIDSGLSSLPHDVVLWVSTSPGNTELIKHFIQNGFADPYISTKSPLGYKFNKCKLCMFRKNELENKEAANEVKFVLKQYNENLDYCVLKFMLEKSTLNYFSKLSNMGSTWNGDKNISQKEVSGILDVSNISDDLVFTLKIEKNSILHGKEENVYICGGIYNFHSHPAEAYVNNNVKLGWPSAQDYVGFLMAHNKYGTLVHFVVTLEGLYIISLSKEWIETKRKITKKMFEFVRTNYNFDSRNDLGEDLVDQDNPNENRKIISYVKIINNIKYKGARLICLQFFNWHDTNRIFSVSVPKKCSNYFVFESMFKKFEQYNK